MNNDLINEEFVVFDLETTGLYPHSKDTIIEIGAVRIKNQEVVDRYDELIYPNKELDEEIIKITSITNEMLKGKRNEKDAVIDFLKWVNNTPMVAHNAKFDMSFLDNACERYELEKINNVVIDTLGLSRYLESSERFHNLATLVKRYNIPWDEEKHHRGDYDAEGTALILIKMLKKLQINGFNKIEDLYKYPFIVIRK